MMKPISRVKAKRAPPTAFDRSLCWSCICWEASMWKALNMILLMSGPGKVKKL